jgi:hypothetical protein
MSKAKPTKSTKPRKPTKTRGGSREEARQAIAQAFAEQAAATLVPAPVEPAPELRPVQVDAATMAALEGTREAFETAQRCCLGSRRLQELRALLARAEAEVEVTSLEADGATERSICLGQLVETIRRELGQ